MLGEQRTYFGVGRYNIGGATSAGGNRPSRIGHLHRSGEGGIVTECQHAHAGKGIATGRGVDGIDHKRGVVGSLTIT